MKTVLHLNAGSSGGAFVAAQRLSEALNESGEIKSEHLVFSGNPGNYHLWADTWVKKKYAFALHAAEKLGFLRYEKDKSIRFAFSHGKTGIDIASNPLVKAADIIHLHWINKGFISLNGLEKLLQTGKPVVWTCHDMWPFTGGCYHNRGCENYLGQCGNCQYLKNPKSDDISSAVFEKKLEIYKKYPNLSFVTPSHWLADRAKESGMKIGNKISVIPNGIDTEKFRNCGNKKQFREKLNLPEKGTILFISGNLSNPYKGFKEFVQAMKQLIQTESDFQIVALGSRVPELDYANLPIVFSGSVASEEEIIDYYNAADIYVTTSLEENLPTTVVESIACGTPVVAFNVGGTSDIIADGVNGFLVEKRDTNGISERVSAVLNFGSGGLQIMAENCRNKALRDFSMQGMVNEMQKVYNYK